MTNDFAAKKFSKKLVKIDGPSFLPIGTKVPMRAALGNYFKNGNKLSNVTVYI